MKYIIMADGKGTRWNLHQGIPKHFIKVNGETLLERTVRLLRQYDPSCQVIITSHDPRYEVDGALRYEPKNNVLEIDRFTAELIENNVCFLYGDTYYSEISAKTIVETDAEDLLFFGNERSIVAVKVADAAIFSQHVNRVRELFLAGRIDKCIGWQVYQSFTGLPFGEKTMTEKYVFLTDDTRDFNSPEDLKR
ncbi:NTP transferase domain-containing protein [Ihubacter sp. rT4E-8]|uniref:NTP transferase domain-containing protein n=1 Tax=unclassified Ihubacter TaxID=2633299 RepID=UPI003C7B92F6